MEKSAKTVVNGIDILKEEIKIPVPWGFVSGQWFGPKDIQPVLCLHGWQDNSNSFAPLLEISQLKTHSYLAIDLPGHGRSSHYPKGMVYYIFWDGISLIRRIVKHFKWEKPVRLMGHSLGGALSFMYAASFPNEVEKLISLDMAGPTVRDHKKLAEQTGECIDRFLKYETLPESKMPSYDYDEMISLVLDAYRGSVDEKAVKILMERGMEKNKNGNGYHFARDLRLKVAMIGMFSEEQVLAYAEQIKCEILNIKANPGMCFGDPSVYPKVIEVHRKNAKRLQYEEVEGTHHVHLADPEKVEGLISEFLNN